MQGRGFGGSGPHRPGPVLQDRKVPLLRRKDISKPERRGFKANYYDVETGEQYWISGCHRDGADRLYTSNLPVEIDEDVRDEYWTSIRGRQPA